MVIKRSEDRLLTDVELELMNVIWHLGKATVKNVMEQLTQERDLAYTTVATVMKILEKKGFLTCHKDSYAHVFSPLVSKNEYESTCLEHIVNHVFDGEPVALVQRLLEAKSLDKEDLIAIKEALKKLKNMDGNKK